MSPRRFFRRLRGALGNAFFWAVSWSAVSGSVFAVWVLTGRVQIANPWGLALYVAASSGASGFLTGLAFSAYVTLAYREKTVLELRAFRVAIGGAAVAAVFSAGIGVLTRTAVGIPLAVADLATGGFWAAVLGMVMAGGSVRIAQRATRRQRLPSTPRPESIGRRSVSDEGTNAQEGVRAHGGEGHEE